MCTGWCRHLLHSHIAGWPCPCTLRLSPLCQQPQRGGAGQGRSSHRPRLVFGFRLADASCWLESIITSKASCSGCIEQHQHTDCLVASGQPQTCCACLDVVSHVWGFHEHCKSPCCHLAKLIRLVSCIKDDLQAMAVDLVWTEMMHGYATVCTCWPDIVQQLTVSLHDVQRRRQWPWMPL